MRITLPVFVLLLASGCATAPAKLCDAAGPAAVLGAPPVQGDSLVAALVEGHPGLLNSERDHWVWLQAESGALLLCTYQRAPVLTDTCGAYVHVFEPQIGDTFAYTRTWISACH